MNQPLAEMFHYNAWGNNRLFNACRDLSDEQLDTHVPGTSGSIRELLTHVVGAQQTFILRTKGRQHEGELTRKSPWPGMETLIRLAASTSDELIAIAARLDGDEHVDLPYMGTTYRYPKRFFLVHAFAHGAEHRTEVKIALAHIGIQTPDLDAWNYAADAGYGQPVDP